MEAPTKDRMMGCYFRWVRDMKQTTINAPIRRGDFIQMEGTTKTREGQRKRNIASQRHCPR